MLDLIIGECCIQGLHDPLCKRMYCTRAIKTRGLYAFNPLFEVHLCTVTFTLCMVSIQERVIVARARYV